MLAAWGAECNALLVTGHLDSQGDVVEVLIITKEGIKRETMELKQD